MVSDATSADFVRVDAVFSDDSMSQLHLSAGERLREARGKAGLTLDAAATQTRIRRDYLEALETMDPRGLPARAYAIGYLRTYASFLTLEPDMLVEQFKREVDTETGRAQPTAAQDKGFEIKLPRGAFGAVLILAGLVGVAYWYAGIAGQSGGFSTLPSPPDAAPEWAREGFESAFAPTRVEEIWTDLPLGEAADAAGVVLMRAASPTWMEVRDASGRILFARELAAGETYRAAEAGLTVSVENAGAVALEIDGVVVGNLGEDGLSVENVAVMDWQTAEAEPQ